MWVSPAGNFHGSTLVRLWPTDPPASTLALLAAVALEEAVRSLCSREATDPVWIAPFAGERLTIKWPNDLMLGQAKLAGILLERAEDAVVIGIGVNLAQHPDLTDRRTTSLAAAGHPIAPEPFADILVVTVAHWLARWRREGLAPIRRRWLDRAHPVGTALTARLPDGSSLDGLFDGLDADGALLLRLAGGERRVIHAGDVFLL